MFTSTALFVLRIPERFHTRMDRPRANHTLFPLIIKHARIIFWQPTLALFQLADLENNTAAIQVLMGTEILSWPFAH